MKTTLHFNRRLLPGTLSAILILITICYGDLLNAQTVYNSGSFTYTVPAGGQTLKIECWGGGGGGGGTRFGINGGGGGGGGYSLVQQFVPSGSYTISVGGGGGTNGNNSGGNGGQSYFATSSYSTIVYADGGSGGFGSGGAAAPGGYGNVSYGADGGAGARIGTIAGGKGGGANGGAGGNGSGSTGTTPGGGGSGAPNGGSAGAGGGGRVIITAINSISTGTVSSNLCAGSTISVPFTFSGAFTSPNVFTAELSNINGVFPVTPNVIGTLTGTTGSSITATIPSTQPTGTGYRIRVVGSNPATTGSDNGTNLTINATPTASITSNNGPICAGGTASFTLNGTNGATVTYNLNNSNTNSTVVLSNGTATILVSNATASQTLSLVSVSNGSCSQIVKGFSTVTVNALPSAPAITAINSTCQQGCAVGGGSFSTTSSCSGGTLTYFNDNLGTNPTTTPPTYNQTASMTIYYACVDNNTTCRSAIQSLATTPGSCTPPTVAPITGTTTLCQNSTTTLSNATSGGAWSSSNASATVSSAGLVTGVSAGSSNITYTVTDANGCTGAASTAIMVNGLPADPANPTFSSPGCGSVTLTYSGSSASGFTEYWQGANAAGISTQSPASSNYTATASGTYYIRTRDNITSCWSAGSGSAAVVVNPLPAATASAAAPACPGGNDGSLSFGTPSAGSPSFTYSIDGGTSYQSGNVFSGLTAGNGYSAVIKDGNGCISSAQSIAVPAGVDNTAPVLTCPAAAVSMNVAGNTCAAAYTIADPISDNCTGTTWGATFSGNSNGNPAAISGIADGSGSGPISFQKGVTTVMLNGVDGSNNSAATCQFTVMVIDNVNPAITAPANKTVSGYCAGTAAPASAVALGTPTVTDNCGAVSYSNNAPASYPLGSTIVTWTATDAVGNQKLAFQTVTITGPAVALGATAAAAPLYPMAGQKIQTVFLNYPASAQTDSIKISATGGTAPYSYSWTMSGCNNTTAGTPFSTALPFYVFAPAAPGNICNGNGDNVFTFNITVTDDHGCKAAAVKRINVVNPYTASGDVLVCHKIATRGSLTYQLNTLTPAQAVTAVGAGDQLGNCSAFTGRTSLAAGEAPAGDAALLSVYPNPSTGVFTVALSAVESGAEIIVTDVQGKMVAQKRIAAGGALQASFDLDGISRGLYLVSVRDGERLYRAKLVLQ